MKDPTLGSFCGIVTNQNRKIKNKLNLNTENKGIGDFSHNLLYSNYGGHYGDGTVEKSKLLVNSLNQTSLNEAVARTKTLYNPGKLNLKYFSAERGTPAEDARSHFVLENEKNDKGHCILIDSDPTAGRTDGETVVRHCRRRNVTRTFELTENNQKSSHDERKGGNNAFENGPKTDKHGKSHKLLAVPCEKNFFTQGERFCVGEKGNFCDGHPEQKKELTDNELQRILNARVIKETGSDYSYGPYVLIPKHIYCLNQQSKRSRRSDEEDPYFITPPVDASIETSFTNLRDLNDDDLIEELKRRKIELPESEVYEMDSTEKKLDKDVVDVKTKLDTVSEPSENPDKLRDEEKRSQLPVAAIQAKSDPPDKTDRNKKAFVQEIKYYEGSLNFFGGEDKEESPYLKITKTVTFEKERGGKPGEKALGIDSWVQTDGDYNDSEKESSVSNDGAKNLNAILAPSLNEPLLQTAKVCGECLKILAGRYGGGKNEGNQENPTAGKLRNDRIDKSTSIEKRGQNVMGLEMIKDDFVRFIAELFLEAIPKEIYNRIMGGNDRLNNEEYEVRVKSYEKESAESCNLKTCKMRNPEIKPDGRQYKDELKNEKSAGFPGYATAEAHHDPKSFEESKKDGENTYDCQITLNGRKILVKVNKSVEDLLLSGNIRNILRISPNENRKDPKGNQGSPPGQEAKDRDPGKTKIPGTCTCSDELRNSRKTPVKTQPNYENREKGYGTQRESKSAGPRRGESFPGFDTVNTQKKVNNDYAQAGRSAKPLLTSPPSRGFDGKKPDMSRNQDKNIPFNNTKSLFWSNVEVFNKMNEENALKTKKVKVNECDPLGRIRSRPEYPYKAYANRRQSCTDEKPKKCHGPGSVRQSDEGFPLFWGSQYLKYCDQIMSENAGCAEKSDNCDSSIREGQARNFVHEIEKRMMVAPNFGKCNAIDAPRPLCIIKISDNKNCESPQYHDYTVANVTSMELNSNPFDMGTITCRKCIETLQSCSRMIDPNWAESKRHENYGDINICDFCWNGVTGKQTGESLCPEVLKGDKGTKSDTTIGSNEFYNIQRDSSIRMPRKSRNYCFISGQCYPNEKPTAWNSEKPFLTCDSIARKVSCHKLHGICFSVNIITHQDAPNIDEMYNDRLPDTKDVGVSTTNVNMSEVETKTSSTQTSRECDKDAKKMRLEKKLSYIYFSMIKRGSKASLKTENPALTSEDPSKMVQTPAVSDSTYQENEVATDGIKSDENVQVLLRKEGVSISDDSITADGESKMRQTVPKRKFSFGRSLAWWRKKKNKV